MSNVYFVAYDATGRIVLTGNCVPSDFALQASDGLTYLESSADPATQYIRGGRITARPACPIIATVTARVVSLAGVPAGAAYTISGDAQLSGTADASGALTFTFGAAGAYQIAIPCFPAIDFTQGFTLP